MARADTFSFTFSRALAECLRSAGCIGGMQTEEDLTTDGKGPQSDRGLCANACRMFWGPRGRRELTAGEHVAAFKLASWVDSSVFPCFS